MINRNFLFGLENGTVATPLFACSNDIVKPFSSLEHTYAKQMARHARGELQQQPSDTHRALSNNGIAHTLIWLSRRTSIVVFGRSELA
jgi:hypothetical protein